MIISLAQFILPLPVVHTINNSGVIFIFFIDYLINGVKINIKQLFGIISGIFGVFVEGNTKLINKYLFNIIAEDKTKFQHYITNDPKTISLFTCVFITMMMFWAYGATLTKKLKANTFQINFTMGLIILIGGAIIYPFTENKSSGK